jgi:hypothetical protein
LSPLAGGAVEADAQVALKQAIVACKAEAKGKKIKWLSRRKYVNQCVVTALKERPSIDVARMLKEHPELTNIPVAMAGVLEPCRRFLNAS